LHIHVNGLNITNTLSRFAALLPMINLKGFVAWVMHRPDIHLVNFL